MSEEDDRIENVYLLIATESELMAISEILQNAHYWHSEMIRLQQENENLRQLVALHEQTIKRLEGRP